MAGGFFGGLAEGIDTSRQQATQQQQVDQQGIYQKGELQLQQQQFQHQQQRELFARADKDTAALMETASHTIEALQQQGKDPATIAKTIQPIIQPLKRLMKSAGRDDSTVDAQISVLLAKPFIPTQEMAKPAPMGEDILGKTYGVYNPKTGKYEAESAGGIAPGGPSRASPSDIPAQPSGTGPQPPGQNMTDQNAMVVPDSTGAPPPSDPMAQALIAKGIITQEQLDFRAERYLGGDKSQVQGTGYGKYGQVVRNAITNRAAELAISRHMSPGDVNAAQAGFGANTASLKQLTLQKNAVQTFENTTLKNMDKLIEIADKVDKTGSPVIERWLRAGRQAVAGDPDVAEFNTQMQLVRAETAKILTNPNLTGVLTVEAQREIATALPSASSAKQIRAVANLLRGDFGRRSQAIDEQLAKIKKDFNSSKPEGKSGEKVTDWTDYH